MGMLRSVCLGGRLAVRIREHSRFLSSISSTVFENKDGRTFNLPEDLQPRLVEGKWRKPQLSAMARKRLRKEILAAGVYWDPTWDVAGKTTVYRPPKSIQKEQLRQERADAITEKLKTMQQQIEEHRAKKRVKKVSYRFRDFFV